MAAEPFGRSVDLVLDTIRCARETRDRIRLLKADIAIRKAFAGQSEPFFDDGFADVLVGGIRAVSDFAVMSSSRRSGHIVANSRQ